MVSTKLLGGFVSGFSLAVFLFSSAVFLYTAPQIESMQNAHELNELVFASTHSPEFDTGLAVIDSLGAGSQIPFIGEHLGYTGNLKDLLLASKELSETARQNLELFIFLTGISLYFMIGSLLAFIIGTILTLKPEKRVLGKA